MYCGLLVAEESDFIPVSLPILLTASSSSPQTVAIQIVDDAVLEDREYFIVQLFSTDPRVALQQPATATVWIMNDDSKPIIVVKIISWANGYCYN